MSSNTSLYAVPVAWIVALAPRGYSIFTYTGYTKTKQGPEAKNPRSFTTQVANDTTLPPLIRDRIIRAESAQLNGAENLGFFAAAVAVGNAAGLDAGTLNKLAWGYVASRVLYNIIFVHNDTEKYVFVRTAMFVIGTGINCALFILAGKQWQRDGS